MICRDLNVACDHLALCSRLLPHVQSLPSLCIGCLWPAVHGYPTFGHREAVKTLWPASRGCITFASSEDSPVMVLTVDECVALLDPLFRSVEVTRL
jgi:hypothetical protein